MRPTDLRRFTIRDAMVLVAASAVALTVIRQPPPNASAVWDATLWSGPLAAFAASMAAALIPLRWFRPRPSAARIVRQPGAVACLATVAAMVLGATFWLIDVAMIRYGPQTPGLTIIIGGPWWKMVDTVPRVVASAWLAMALAGRWSPEPSWIDRLGRVIGLFWVAELANLVLSPVYAYLSQ